jgi:hypothetical protein|tara:strand:- start:348 stop:572 length:225 start_codon:yes stop_codon:yes gene_type:complete
VAILDDDPLSKISYVARLKKAPQSVRAFEVYSNPLLARYANTSCLSNLMGTLASTTLECMDDIIGYLGEPLGGE